MKPNYLFFPSVFIAFLLGSAQLASGQVEINLTEHTASTNGTTYRLYAEFDETANITSVFAPEAIYQDQWWPGLDPSDSSDDLPPNSIPSISFATDASNGFFQFALGQHYNTPSGIIPSLFQFYPDMEFDSWFTIGGAEGVSAGVQLIPGQTDALNNFNNGGSFDTDGFADGGGWYTATSTPIYTDENGQILLAQLTVEEGASIDVVLSLIWRDDNAVSHVEIGLTASIGDNGAGCMDSMACNYNSSATEAGDCVFASDPCESCSGESDGTGTIVLNDADGDDVCDSDEVIGCQNASACNYNSSATDSGVCSFASGCDECAGNPTNGSGFVQDNDADNDGVCDVDEVLGCTNSSACNYLEDATEDSGACVLPANCETCTGETDGSGTIVDNDQDGDGVCDVDEVAGCLDASACNYNAQATDDGGGCIYATGCDYCSGATDGSGSILNGDTDGDSVCNSDEIEGCLDSMACNYNQFATDSSACEYAFGCAECSGADDGTGMVVANDDDEDGVCNVDEISGCQDSNACNYNNDATDDSGDCQYPAGCDSCSGASDGSGVIIDNDADNDGVCDADEIVGCQVPSACNFNENATESGDCTYPDTGYNCAGVCLNDFDGDGVCDVFEVSGCVYASACNYDASATDDDGSCVFAASGLDCAGNCLFDVDEDGVCDQIEITGCLDASACNYNASATEAGYCVYSDSGYDCNGDCIADADADGICDAFEVDGCSDSSACNYDAAATDDDGTCLYAGSGLDCAGNCLFDVDEDGVCDQSKSRDVWMHPPAITTPQQRKRVIVCIPIRDTTATEIALPMRTRMEFATLLKWMDVRTAARATMMRQQRTTTDHACLQDQDWTARAIACLTWMRTAFATNPKSRDVWMHPPAITTPQLRKRVIVCIPIRDTTATEIALPMRTRMEFATLLKWMDVRTAARAIMMRQRQMTTDHACLQDQDWTARAIACLTWMRTAFATNPKSRDVWMHPRAITTPQLRKRDIVCIPNRDTTATEIALPMRTQMEFATLLK